MNKNEKVEIAKMIGIAAEVCGVPLRDRATAVMVKRLAHHDFKQVESALINCMDELSGRLTLAEIKKRIDDGRPCAELAWAGVPKNEYESAVLTSEQHIALCCVSAMIDQGDLIPARMGFKEKYESLVAKARTESAPTKFVLAAGFDRQGRIDAVTTALDAGLLTQKQALSLLPEAKREILSLAPPESNNVVSALALEVAGGMKQ